MGEGTSIETTKIRLFVTNAKNPDTTKSKCSNLEMGKENEEEMKKKKKF